MIETSQHSFSILIFVVDQYQPSNHTLSSYQPHQIIQYANSILLFKYFIIYLKLNHFAVQQKLT